MSREALDSLAALVNSITSLKKLDELKGVLSVEVGTKPGAVIHITYELFEGLFSESEIVNDTNYSNFYEKVSTTVNNVKIFALKEKSLSLFQQ